MRRGLRPYLAAAGKGIKASAVFVGRWIGPYEICEGAVGVGSYLLAREFWAVAPAVGIALIAGGGLACLINLLTDLSWTKHVEGSKR